MPASLKTFCNTSNSFLVVVPILSVASPPIVASVADSKNLEVFDCSILPGSMFNKYAVLKASLSRFNFFLSLLTACSVLPN